MPSVSSKENNIFVRAISSGANEGDEGFDPFEAFGERLYIWILLCDCTLKYCMSSTSIVGDPMHIWDDVCAKFKLSADYDGEVQVVDVTEVSRRPGFETILETTYQTWKNEGDMIVVKQRRLIDNSLNLPLLELKHPHFNRNLYAATQKSLQVPIRFKNNIEKMQKEARFIKVSF